MSLLPRGGHKFAPNPKLVDERPEIYINMGLTAEEIQRRWKIQHPRAKPQDAFSLSQPSRNALQGAVRSGKFDDEKIVPVTVETFTNRTARSPRRICSESSTFNKDEGPRADTFLEALGRV